MSSNPIAPNFGLVLGVKGWINPQFTNILSTKAFVKNNYSLKLGVNTASLVAVTNASSVTNPNTPTLILNGTVIYSNTLTTPSSTYLPNIKCYVGLNCSNVITGPFGGLNVSDLYSWNISLDDRGGTWQVNSINNFGNYGNPVSVFGFTGTITEKGFSWSRNSAGYLVGGILGQGQLNQQLAMFAYGLKAYNSNLTNQYLSNPGPQDVKTHQDAATMIANLAGVGLSWNVPDFPLYTFQPQASMTAMEALSSLASECGGVLRWDGGNNYVVTYPNVPTGYWNIPDCCLVVSAAVKCSEYLPTGTYNPGVTLVPQLGIFDGGTISIIANYGSVGNAIGGLGVTTPSQITNSQTTAALFYPGAAAVKPPVPIYQSTTLYTPTSAPQVVPLDLDVDAIYIQNVTVSDTSGPYNSNGNPNNWSLLQRGIGSSTGGSTGYVQWVDINGVLQPQLQLSASFFPQTNTDATKADNSWYLRIGVTKVQVPVPFTDTAQGSYMLARTLMKYRFVPICTGTLTCAFFGSIPVPGMQLSGSFNGQPLTGIIESVNFTNPGILNINFVQWAVLEYYTNLSTSNNTSLPGFPTSF